MASKNNVHCAICNKGYYICMSCGDTKVNPYKLHTDTPEHFKVFQILRGHTLGVYTTEEAMSKLKNVDLSDKDSFTESVKKHIDEIMSVANKITPNVEKGVDKAIKSNIIATDSSVKKKNKNNYV